MAVVKKKTAGKGAKALTKPVKARFLRGTKIENKPQGHPDRPKFNKITTNNYTKLPKPRFDKSSGKWLLNVKHHNGWKRSEYRHKVDTMKSAGAQGRLQFVQNTSSARTSGQKDKRKAVEDEARREATDLYKKGDTAGAQKLWDERMKKLDGEEADHTIELQVGGSDSQSNLKMIDPATNHGMGGQLRNQLEQARKMGMKPGDLVDLVELPGSLSNR